jgi:hypothetical protein
MKSKNKILYPLLGALILLAFGCNNKLEEHPFTVFTTEYYKTPDGIQNGVNALYSGLRYNFGPEGACAVTNVGTDEWTYADQVRSASQQGDVLTLGKYTLDYANGAILTPWNRGFNNINLANLIITDAPLVTFSSISQTIDSTTRAYIVAQAKYLRAQYYMLLVPQFGAVPTDLGSGDLKFNSTPFQGFNRLPVADVLKKDYDFIIQDLIDATKTLPDQRPTNSFKLAKPAAFALLAKAYIFRAYSSVAQSTDFANALAAAEEVINNQGKYGVALQPTYGTVHKPGNDYNSEILYSCERLPGNNDANEYNNPQSIGGTKGIDASNDFCPDYTAVAAPLASSSAKPCRTRLSLYGRPIRRFCPTQWLYDTAFADKDNDSRYDGTFRTMWRATVTTTSGSITYNYNSSNQDLSDTVFILAKTNQIADSLNSLTPKKNYRIIAPREFYFFSGFSGQNIYPALSKYEDPNKGNFNDEGGRPFVVSKLSEVYLLAAEAAFQTGDKVKAAAYINVLKQRAANRINLSPNEITDITKKSPLGAAAAITIKDANGNITSGYLSPSEVDRRYKIIKTPDDGSQITLDYILDERTRELCGESQRWQDLAMRGKLVERVKADNPDGAPNIQSYHVLRPIPKSQLDNTNDPNKAQYQNPGY